MSEKFITTNLSIYSYSVIHRTVSTCQISIYNLPVNQDFVFLMTFPLFFFPHQSPLWRPSHYTICYRETQKHTKGQTETEMGHEAQSVSLDVR
jgi:hypothetical protein